MKPTFASTASPLRSNARTWAASASALAIAALLGACASTPVPPPELVEARDAVRMAETDPDVLAKAPGELKKASDTLVRANKAFNDRQPLGDVQSASHVAKQQARAAIAVAKAKANEDAIKNAEADRERARADVRTAEADRARMQANAARAQAANAEARASTAETQAANASAQAMSAQAQAANAESQAASAQAQAASAQAQAAALQQKLDELQAKQTERGVLVTLGDVLFEFNRAEVKTTATAELRKLADFLQQYPGRRILIEGHTDNIGSDAYNQQLSRRRAESVASALQAMGVQAPRVSVVGYGKSYPVADNSSDTNRALNRRVEVYLSDNDQPVRPRG